MIAPNRPHADPPTGPDADLNVLGTSLQPCGVDPLTGYFRDGTCRTCAQDTGSHTVCAVMTTEFLAYSKARGNDLSTPSPANRFPGLQPGDPWCLCAPRWQEALEAGQAPPVILEATHARALESVSLDALQQHDARD